MYRRRVRIRAIALAAPGVIDASELLAGPRVGDATGTSTRIVKVAEPADVRLDNWLTTRLRHDETGQEPMVRGLAHPKTAEGFPHTGIIALACKLSNMP